MTDIEDPTSEPEKPEDTGRKPASKNPLYVLATLYGEGDDFGTHIENRLAWNAWACQNLTPTEKKEITRKINRDIFKDVVEWSSIKEDVVRRFKERLPEASFPRPDDGIEFIWSPREPSPTSFDGFIFPNFADFCHINFAKYTSFNSAIFLYRVDFESANFNSYAKFSNTLFMGGVVFMNANFDSSLTFRSSVFCEYASFRDVKFKGSASFIGAKFLSSVDFRNAHFQALTNFTSYTHFSHTVFAGEVNFDEAIFDTSASFRSSVFCESASFRDSVFKRPINFTDARFEPSVDFRNADFQAPTNFMDANFITYPNFVGAVLHSKTLVTASDKFWPDRGWLKSFIQKFDWRRSKTLREAGVRMLLSRDEIEKSPKRLAKEDAVHEANPVDAPESIALSCANLRHNMAAQGLPDEAHFFFRREMWARALTAAWYERWLYRIYDWVFSFGHSLIKPIAWLGLLWLVCAGLFATSGSLEHGKWALLSFANTFSFFGFHKIFFADPETLGGLSGELQFLIGAQIILSFILLFFLGLALRNRFRLT